MGKKKVVFYIESMIVGGAEKVLIDLVNNLDSEKFDITVIALFKRSVYSNYEFKFEDGFKPHIHYKYLIDNTSDFKYKLFSRLYNRLPKSFFYKWLIKEKYDIEVAFYEGWPTDFVSYSNQKSRKIAWLHIHQDHIYGINKDKAFVQNRLSKYLLFDTIVGVSNDVCQSFKDIFHLENVQCVYNPIDDALVFRKSETSVDTKKYQPYFLTIGRMSQQKGYERLINVAYKLKTEGYSFTIVMLGEGALKEKFIEQIKQYGLEQYVILLGHSSNPFPYLKQAQSLLMSSYHEGLSTVVIESLIVGTPVLTTNCSGMQELIDNDFDGKISENSEEGIYNMLKYVLDNPTYLTTLKNNINNSERKFNLKKQIAAVEDVLIGKEQ